jgi:glutaryl-CoA dehydrogenase
MVRDAARDYAQGRLAPRIVEAFRREHSDPRSSAKWATLGLLGATIPEEFGGGGLNYVSYGLIAREIERVDSGYRSMMSVQSSLVMLPIHAVRHRGAEAPLSARAGARRIDRLLRLTEPDHGSDPGSMVTRAREASGGFA